MTTFESIATSLWDLLDDIDTLGDAVKGNDKAFRSAALKLAAKRFKYAKSDGYKLLWIEGRNSCSSCPAKYEECDAYPDCKMEIKVGGV